MKSLLLTGLLTITSTAKSSTLPRSQSPDVQPIVDLWQDLPQPPTVQCTQQYIDATVKKYDSLTNSSRVTIYNLCRAYLTAPAVTHKSACPRKLCEAIAPEFALKTIREEIFCSPIAKLLGTDPCALDKRWD